LEATEVIVKTALTAEPADEAAMVQTAGAVEICCMTGLTTAAAEDPGGMALTEQRAAMAVPAAAGDAAVWEVMDAEVQLRCWAEP